MQLYFGARGVTDLELTVYGPGRVLHDGHYGNWAPNPAAVLVDLLAHIRDANSHILIPGFYDDVRALTPAERQAIAQSPDVDTPLKQELGLAWTESAGASLPMAITQPALNIRGIEAGHVEEKAQNAISTTAKASIDFRWCQTRHQSTCTNWWSSSSRSRVFISCGKCRISDAATACEGH